MITNESTETKSQRPRVTEKAMQKMTLRQLVETYNTLNAGQPPLKASAFKNKTDGIQRIKALQRRLRRTVVPSEGTIRSLAENLLKTDLRYSEILAEVQETFPDAKTSRSSLRWYAAQMRARGESLPERPLDI